MTELEINKKDIEYIDAICVRRVKPNGKTDKYYYIVLKEKGVEFNKDNLSNYCLHLEKDLDKKYKGLYHKYIFKLILDKCFQEKSLLNKLKTVYNKYKDLITKFKRV